MKTAKGAARAAKRIVQQQLERSEALGREVRQMFDRRGSAPRRMFLERWDARDGFAYSD